MKPLTTKQRTRSLLLLALLFVFTAPIILLYSMGYRLDDEYTLQKTGGIFVHSDVANSSVFVDGEFLRNNGIFIRNTWIQDLTPNKFYKVEFHKDGFQSWVKDIYVYPSVVSEGRVLMLPNEFEKKEILPYVDEDNVATSTPPSRTALIPTNPYYLTLLELFEPTVEEVEIEKKTSTSSASSTVVKQKTDIELFFETLGIEDYELLPNLIVSGKEVSWLSEGNINLHWMSDISSVPYYYCGGEIKVCEKNITLDWNDDIRHFAYMPGRDDVWIVLIRNAIFAVEVDGRTRRNIQLIYEGEDLDFRLTRNDRIIIKEDGGYFEINL